LLERDRMQEAVRFIIPLAAIYGGIAVGYGARKWRPEIEGGSARLMRAVIVWLEPGAIFLGFWNLSVEQAHGLWRLPVAAGLISLACIPVAALFARAHGLTGPRAGAYVGAGMFSNVGATLGGFLCLLFMGTDGFALSQAYAFYFVPFFFTIGFAVARRYTGEAPGSLGAAVREFLTDPVRVAPTVGIVLGLLANRYAPHPPVWTRPAVTWLVCVTTFLYSVAIGASLHLGRMAALWRESLSIAFIKFAITPFIGLAVAALLGCTTLQSGVVFVESCMPAAIFTLVLSALCRLDRHLANACWLFTTMATLPLIPGIYFVLVRVVLGRG